MQHLHKVHSQRDVQGDILGWNAGTGARQSRILAECRVLTTSIACALIPSTQLLQTFGFQGLAKRCCSVLRSPTSPHTPRAVWESDNAQHPTGRLAFPTGSLSLQMAPDAGQRSGTAQLFTLLCFYHCLFHELVKSSVQKHRRGPCEAAVLMTQRAGSRLQWGWGFAGICGAHLAGDPQGCSLGGLLASP